MTHREIRSKTEEQTWRDLEVLPYASHQRLSGSPDEILAEDVARYRVRPQVPAHLERSIAENEELGALLAQ